MERARFGSRYLARTRTQLRAVSGCDWDTDIRVELLFFLVFISTAEALRYRLNHKMVNKWMPFGDRKVNRDKLSIKGFCSAFTVFAIGARSNGALTGRCKASISIQRRKIAFIAVYSVQVIGLLRGSLMIEPLINTPDIWAPHLRKDEEILWQGRPSPRFHLRRGDIWNIFAGILGIPILIGMVFVFLDLLEPKTGEWSYKLIVGGVIFTALFAAVLYTSVFQLYFATKRRAKTHYAITNQRTMSLITGRKEKFDDQVLDSHTNLDYVPGKLASIYYKKIAKRMAHSDGNDKGVSRRRTTYSTTYTYVGFELIPDGATAYQTMLKVIGAKLANPEAAKASTDGEAWEDFLLVGEELLWQGAPDTGPRPTKLGVILTIIGAIFIYYFGGLAMRTLFSGSDDSGVLIIGAIAALMFLLGLWMAVGIWLLDIRKRKATRYALTNKRAFVASALAGRKMLTYSIKPYYRPLLLKGMMDEVTFGEEDWFDPKTGAKIKRAISFKFLKDGQEVYDNITKVSTEIDAAAEA